MANDDSELSRLMNRIGQATASVVNMEDVLGVTLRFPELKLRAEQYYHYGKFCLFAKFHNRNVACGQNKKKSKQLASRIKRPFWGCCPFGVWDLATPVVWRGDVVAIFYLGYFTDGQPLASVEGRIFDGPLPDQITPDKQAEVQRYGEMLRDYLLLTLAEKDTDGALQKRRKPNLEFYRQATEQYITTHYHKSVNLQSYADQLRLHPNYLGHQVQLACGARFAELLRDYRLQRACLLLRGSQRPITDIAFQCGFQDSNYFSTVFSKIHGMSPRSYRSNASSD